MTRIAALTLAAVAVAAVGAGVGVGIGAAGGAGGGGAAGGGAGGGASGAGCRLHEPKQVSSTRPGATAQLVPPGARALLLCRYATGMAGTFPITDPLPPGTARGSAAGTAGGSAAGTTTRAGAPGTTRAPWLIADRLVTSRATVGTIAGELNAIVPRTGAIACPADFGDHILAYFRYPSGPADPVTVDLSGCRPVSNGHLTRLAMGSPVIARLSALAPDTPPATIRGRVQVCGGPAPGGCHTGAYTSCGPAAASCVTAKRVAIVSGTAGRIALLALRHGRFRAQVPPGRYRIELIGDGRRVHGKVLQSARVRARPGRTIRLTFGVAFP